MKRKDFIRHLEKHGCLLKREGSKHSLWYNPTNGRAATVPRHNELKDFLCIQICRQFDIPRI